MEHEQRAAVSLSGSFMSGRKLYEFVLPNNLECWNQDNIAGSMLSLLESLNTAVGRQVVKRRIES